MKMDQDVRKYFERTAKVGDHIWYATAGNQERQEGVINEKREDSVELISPKDVPGQRLRGLYPPRTVLLADIIRVGLVH